MNPEDLWRKALVALHAGHSSSEIDAWLAANAPQYPSLAHVQQALQSSDQAAATHLSGVLGGIEAFGHGATLGLSPHITAALDALLSAGATPTGVPGVMTGNPGTAASEYNASLGAERGSMAGFAKDHPVLSPVLNAAGGIGAGLAAAPAAAADVAPTVWNLIKSGALWGAGAGTVQGAADAPTLAEAPGDALRSTAIGAGGGALLGAAAKPALTAGSGLLRGLRALMAPGADAAATAEGSIAKALTPEALARLAALRAARPAETMVADAAPDLLTQARMQSGAVNQGAEAALGARNAGAGDRLAQDLTGGTGAPGLDAKDAQAAARAAVRPTAAKLYAPLEAKYPALAPEVPANQALFEELGQPVTREEYNLNAPVGDQHEPSFQMVQATLQGLSDKARAAFRQGAGAEGVRYAGAADRLRAAMEQAMPEFANVDPQYQATQDVMRAFKRGTGALSRDPRDITADLQALAGNPDAQSAYRMAAVDQHAQLLRGLTPKADAFRQAMQSGNQDVVGRLQALFGEDPSVLDQFLKSADAEAYFRRTATAAGGSPTAGRQALAKQIFGDPMSAGSGGLVSRLTSLFSNAATEGRPERIANALGPDLLAQGPQIDQVLAKVAEIRQAQQATARRLRLGVRAAAVSDPIRKGALFGTGLATLPLIERLFGADGGNNSGY